MKAAAAAARAQQEALIQVAINSANDQMNNIGKNLLASGRAKTIDEAVRIACKEHGQTMAEVLQNHLRQLGARDVTVTCP